MNIAWVKTSFFIQLFTDYLKSITTGNKKEFARIYGENLKNYTINFSKGIDKAFFVWYTYLTIK
ncbi:MAG: hypothetical protein IKB61_00915 [Elusimicrobiaceae bacterium]|nr:hypothetical protein [Elusimicrobiaceae bacterium]